MFGMRILSRPGLRWAAPLAIVLVAAGSGLVASTATAQPHLPPTTPEQLLVDLQNVSVDALSGTVEQEANLGIPAIPSAGGTDSSEFNSLLTGKHRLGVWYAAPDKARVALYGDLGESDLIRNGDDVWTWSSQENKATHRTVAADPAEPTPSEVPKTPQEAAQRFIEAISPTTELTIDSTVTVAGRPAYDLVARPKDQGSLVTQSRLAVDGETHLPLRAEVFAGDTTVFHIGYTEINFAQPDPKVFEFTPPPGAEVTEVPPRTTDEKSPSPDQRSPEESDAPKVIGKGWTTVMIRDVPANLDSRSDQGDEQLRAFLRQLPEVSGSWGTGRLLSGTAFTAVVTDDGRLAIGSVTPEVLYAALEK
jgi:outer membrane lipoprotein-sorting protein